MTDVQKLLAETVCAVLSDHASSDTAMRAMDEGLWARLEEAGLTGVSVPEHLGGSGGSLTDAAIVASAVAEAGARVPLVETALEAGWLLQEAGLELPPGPLTAAYVPSGFGRRSKTIDLSVERVPWGRASRHLVIASEAGGADVVTYVST
jgi:acyl-CoA dehydrogenase